MKKRITALAEWFAYRVKKRKQIDYERFMLMKQELGLEASEEEMVIAILKTFYPTDKREWTECVNEFNLLITKQYTGSLKLDLDFYNKEAKYFIRADTYVSNADLVSLYNHLSGRKKKSISVPLAMRVKNEFLQSVAHFKETYPWIYDPPMLPGMNKWSVGRDMRNAFQKDYGQYAELTYLIAITESISFNKVNKKPLSEYLSVGEYLIRKRAVESVE